MKNGLELAVEEFFIQLYRRHPALKSKNIRHSDEDSRVPHNAIVVQATQGNHRLDGPKGYDVQVTVTYRSGVKSTKAQNNLAAGAMVEAVMQARPGLTTAEKQFSYFLIDDEMSSKRDVDDDSRQREQTFNVIARLKLDEENALSH